MKKNLTIKKNTSIPTILISGGAGFIGSHLAERLLDKKARVLVLDDFKTGKDTYVKALLKNPNFALFDVNINDGLPKEIESVDYIFHLAGLEEYLYSKDYLDLDSLLTNSLGTKNLLDLARTSDAKFLLASTIDVYTGRMSQLSIEKYFGFTNLEENKFSLTEAKRFAESMVWEYNKKYSLDARIVRLPEIYGPRMSLEASGFLGNFLRDIIQNHNITITGEETEKSYYLYISDAVSGILKAQFNPKTKGKIYSLVGAPTSALEAAYALKGMADGTVDIKFAGTKEPQTAREPDTFNLADLTWEPRVALKEGLVNTLKWFGYEINMNNFKPERLIKQKDLEKRKKPLVAAAPDAVNTITPSYKYKNPPLLRSLFGKVKSTYISGVIAILVAALGIFAVLPAVQAYTYARAGANDLLSIENQIKQASFSGSTAKALDAVQNFDQARFFVYKLKWLFTITRMSGQYTTVSETLSSLANFSKATSEVSAAAEPIDSFWEIVRPDTKQTLDASVFDDAKLHIANAKDYISLAQADYKYVDAGSLPKNVQAKLADYKNYLDLFGSSLSNADLFMSAAPDILGVTGEKKYVVWFQNSNELRPTGGFIGSYGVLTFNGGKLKDLTIDDIYNPDGQIDLKGINVPPPAPIAANLNEKKLYLRNSNWNPDFPKSTQDFENLYYKVTGDKPDGYVAVDLNFVNNLLKVTGPIFLTAYNEEINSSNLYERAQYHSDFDYTNGSNQKRSFLTVLGSKLLENLFSLPKARMSALLSAVVQSLNDKDMLVYLDNSPINTYLKAQHWDGSLVATTGDYLYVVNANLGGTKANYYVKNSMNYEVTSMTRDGVLRGNLTLDYKNTATSDAWPGGPYTDYVRVLTQAGTKLTGAKLVAPDGTDKDIFKTVIISNEGKYSSFEFSFKLNFGQEEKVVLAYDLPANENITQTNKVYSLYWQKQPGTSGDSYGFKFGVPFGMSVIDSNGNLKYDKNSAQDSGTLASDKNYYIKLQ
jgi:nucleoside-diphosphate-sugar epimerase